MGTQVKPSVMLETRSIEEQTDVSLVQEEVTKNGQQLTMGMEKK